MGWNQLLSRWWWGEANDCQAVVGDKTQRFVGYKPTGTDNTRVNSDTDTEHYRRRNRKLWYMKITIAVFIVARTHEGWFQGGQNRGTPDTTGTSPTHTPIWIIPALIVLQMWTIVQWFWSLDAAQNLSNYTVSNYNNYTKCIQGIGLWLNDYAPAKELELSKYGK